MARERQITVTLRPRVWAEFLRRREEALRLGAGERGIDSEVINDWLVECMLRSGSGDGAPLPRPQLADEPPPSPATADDDDFGFDLSKL
jgi:hypothetical protein